MQLCISFRDTPPTAGMATSGSARSAGPGSPRARPRRAPRTELNLRLDLSLRDLDHPNLLIQPKVQLRTLNMDAAIQPRL